MRKHLFAEIYTYKKRMRLHKPTFVFFFSCVRKLDSRVEAPGGSTGVARCFQQVGTATLPDVAPNSLRPDAVAPASVRGAVDAVMSKLKG